MERRWFCEGMIMKQMIQDKEFKISKFMFKGFPTDQWVVKVFRTWDDGEGYKGSDWRDVEFLEKVGRYFDKVRKKQKENHPELFPKKEKVSARDRLRLRFSSGLPSLSSLREVKL